MIAAHKRRAPKRKPKRFVKVIGDRLAEAADQIVQGKGSSELERLLSEKSALSLVKDRQEKLIKQLKEESTPRLKTARWDHHETSLKGCH